MQVYTRLTRDQFGGKPTTEEGTEMFLVQYRKQKKM
jgi:hypothetical protein